MDKYKYHPEYDGTQQEKKRAGLLAKAALIFAGAATTGAVGGAAFEAGRSYQKLSQTRAEQTRLDNLPNNRDPLVEQEEELEEPGEGTIEEEKHLPVTVISKKFREVDGKGYVDIAAMIGDRTFGVKVPILIKPESIKGDLQQEDHIRIIEGKEVPVTILEVASSDGSKSKVALLDSPEGLFVMLEETDAQGQSINLKDIIIEPDEEGVPLPDIYAS